MFSRKFLKIIKLDNKKPDRTSLRLFFEQNFIDLRRFGVHEILTSLQSQTFKRLK